MPKTFLYAIRIIGITIERSTTSTGSCIAFFIIRDVNIAQKLPVPYKAHIKYVFRHKLQIKTTRISEIAHLIVINLPISALYKQIP